MHDVGVSKQYQSRFPLSVFMFHLLFRRPEESKTYTFNYITGGIPMVRKERASKSILIMISDWSTGHMGDS